MTRPCSSYTLGLGDDALVSAQRMGWWISRARSSRRTSPWPTSGSTSSARRAPCCSYAGQVEGAGAARTTSPTSVTTASFRNVKLVERPMTDFGVAMARLLVLRDVPAPLRRAAAGADETLAGIAGKAVKEVAYHVDHAAHWVLRLGDGTDESPPPHAGRRSTPSGPTSTSCSSRPLEPALAGRVVDPPPLRTPSSSTYGEWSTRRR